MEEQNNNIQNRVEFDENSYQVEEKQHANGKMIVCLLIAVVIIPLILMIYLGSWKSLAFVGGLGCLLMFVNISLTTLGNAFIGRNIDMTFDIFWKIFFIVMSSICFGIYIAL